MPTSSEQKKINQVKRETQEEEKRKMFNKLDRLKNELNIRKKKPARGPNPKAMKKKQVKGTHGISDKLPNRKTKRIRKRPNHIRTKKEKIDENTQKKVATKNE